jgi:hypothetical protein
MPTGNMPFRDDQGVAGGDGEGVGDGVGVGVGGDPSGFFWMAEGEGIHIDRFSARKYAVM